MLPGIARGRQLAGSLDLPTAARSSRVIREERALSVRSDTELRQGDKVIGIAARV